MSYIVTNLVANSNLSIGNLNVPANGSVTVDYLTTELVNALAASQISVSPTVAATEPSPAALTIAVGTPAAGTVDVTGAFSQSVLNNNFATLATQLNLATKALAALQIQVRAHESRLDRSGAVPSV